MVDDCKTDGCEGKVWVIKSGLCSRCYNKARLAGSLQVKGIRRRPLSERIAAKIARGAPDECWEWQGSINVHGYGVTYDGEARQNILAHRAAWIVANGPIPVGYDYHGTVVMHICDNRRCCNPGHLRLGRQADNVSDMHAKKRGAPIPIKRGVEHPRSILTEEHVREIRAASGRGAVKAVRERYGIPRATADQIRSGRTWKHVT